MFKTKSSQLAQTTTNLFLISMILLLWGACAAHCQTPDLEAVIRGVDASVKTRIDHVASYTVTEHYAVFRGADLTKPAAEMTVRTEYHKDHGKQYTIMAESGSSLLRSQLLGSVLAHEKEMSQPGVRETVLVNSTNYQMALKSKEPQLLDGHNCLLLQIKPRRLSPSLFEGTVWVDAKDYSIVQLVGKTSKSHSFLAGASDVVRQYAPVDGFPMATHASAKTHSSLLGDTLLKIDYSNYQVQRVAGN